MYTNYAKPERTHLQNIYSTSIHFSAFVLFALNCNSRNNTVAQFLHSQDKRLAPNKQTVTPVVLYANIKTSSEIRGHLKTLCLMYSYMNGNHIYIHALPTPLPQYQEPVTVGVIYVSNAFSPLVTPDQLLGCNSLPHYKKELASTILNYNKQLTYKYFMSHYHLNRVLILSDNYRLSLLTATPRSMWVVG